QKTAYEITRRDWSSDVCSSDLRRLLLELGLDLHRGRASGEGHRQEHCVRTGHDAPPGFHFFSGGVTCTARALVALMAISSPTASLARFSFFLALTGYDSPCGVFSVTIMLSL